MPTYAWIALAVFAGALVLGIVWVSVNGLRAWRRAWPSVRRMRSASAELSARTTELEQRIASLERRLAALQRDVERLSESTARARVLLGAVQEAKAMVDRIRAFTP